MLPRGHYRYIIDTPILFFSSLFLPDTFFPRLGEVMMHAGRIILISGGCLGWDTGNLHVCGKLQSPLRDGRLRFEG